MSDIPNETDNPNQDPNQSDEPYEILPEGEVHYDMNFKVVVIGDCSVGKSCLSAKATKNQFETDYSATLGFEYFTFNVKIKDKIVRLQIWDTCGQELYRSLITNFYHNTSLAILVYEIDKKTSFDNIQSWLNELRTNSSPDIKLFLIGNKLDLEPQRTVSTEEGRVFAKNCGFNLFMESSAKTGFNAQNIFVEAAKILYKEYIRYNKANSNEANSAAKLKSKIITHNSNEKKCEC